MSSKAQEFTFQLFPHLREISDLRERSAALQAENTSLQQLANQSRRRVAQMRSFAPEAQVDTSRFAQPPAFLPRSLPMQQQVQQPGQFNLMSLLSALRGQGVMQSGAGAGAVAPQPSLNLAGLAAALRQGGFL